MEIMKFSKLNESYLQEKSDYFWDLRQSIYDLGFDDEQIVDFFIEELGKNQSRDILEKLLDKLEGDNF